MQAEPPYLVSSTITNHSILLAGDLPNAKRRQRSRKYWLVEARLNQFEDTFFLFCQTSYGLFSCLPLLAIMPDHSVIDLYFLRVLILFLHLLLLIFECYYSTILLIISVTDVFLFSLVSWLLNFNFSSSSSSCNYQFYRVSFLHRILRFANFGPFACYDFKASSNHFFFFKFD